MDILNFHRYSSEKISYDHAKKTKQSRSDYRPHAHEVYELIFFKEGRVSYTVGGQRYRLSPNDLVFTRPYDIHDIQIDPGEDYDRYNILFDGALISDAVFAEIPADLHVVHFDHNPMVVQLFEKMDFYCGRLSGEVLEQTLSSLIREICVHIGLADGLARENAYTTTNTLVESALDYIEKNLITLTDTAEICEALYITKSHLHHLFAKHLHTSPKKYITAKRLALARREIFAGRRPTEVYMQCGFSDYSAFYRAYLAHFGQPPSAKGGREQLRREGAVAVITHDNTPVARPVADKN